MQIFIRMTNGSTISIDIHPTDTIAKLKEIIYTKTQYPPSVYRLKHQTRFMKDEHTLHDYNVQQYDTINAVYHKYGGVFSLSYGFYEKWKNEL